MQFIGFFSVALLANGKLVAIGAPNDGSWQQIGNSLSDFDKYLFKKLCSTFSGW